MPKLSVIILSKTNSESIYKMNCDAIKSLLDSEDWNFDDLEVRIMESEKNAEYSYPPPWLPWKNRKWISIFMPILIWGLGIQQANLLHFVTMI